MELKHTEPNDFPKLIYHSNEIDDTDRNDIFLSYIPAHLNMVGCNTGWAIHHPKSFRIWSDKSIPDVLCKLINIDKVERNQFLYMWHSLFPIYYRSIFKGGLPFHAGLVELDGKGFLLAAPAETGKSTCCRRLPSYWKKLCDDEALVVLGKKIKYSAHPFPTWSDYLFERKEKTWNVHYSLPLTAIFFIEPSHIDSIKPVGGGNAAVLINDSAFQVCYKLMQSLNKEEQRQFKLKLFENACEVAKIIPAYRLRVSLHGRFWEKMEQVVH